MRKRLIVAFISIYFASITPSLAKNTNFTWYMSLKKDKRETFMRQPLFITFSKNGEKTYVVDGTNKIFSYKTKLGIPGAAFFAAGALEKPIAMTKMSPTEIVVINRGKNEIDKINLKTKEIGKIKVNFKPDKIFEHNGKFYLLDKISGDILILDKNFNILSNLKHGNRDGFIDFKIKGNKIYALSPIKKEVTIFSIQTGKEERAVKLDTAAEKLLLPASIAIDKEKDIYICDKLAGNIKIYSETGGHLKTILEKGQKKGYLYYPDYIAFDKFGRLWVAEEGNGRVEVFERYEEKK